MPLADKSEEVIGAADQKLAIDVADFFGGEFRLLCHTFREGIPLNGGVNERVTASDFEERSFKN